MGGKDRVRELLLRFGKRDVFRYSRGEDVAISQPELGNCGEQKKTRGV